jgi:solute carrier family 25 protein 34/35
MALANVAEVAKTRLQLQGELVKVDPKAPKVYNGVVDVLRKTYVNEGIRGLQRGLMPAVSMGGGAARACRGEC